jgi:hypothetical protein
VTPYALTLLALAAFIVGCGALLAGRPLVWLEFIAVACLLGERAGRGLA